MTKSRVITWTQAVDEATDFLHKAADIEERIPGMAIIMMKEYKRDYDAKIANGELIVLKGE